MDVNVSVTRADRRHAILNTFVDDLSMDETVAAVKQIVQDGRPVQHVVINASKVNLMEEDSELSNIVNSCPLINADGASILWAAKVLGVPLRERVTGIDLFLRLVELAPKEGWKIFLFGAREEVVQTVRKTFEEQYPGISIVGCRNGYFTEADEPEIVAEMAASGADMMFVAFSSPKKERWVHKHLNQLGIPFVMGVGGSFDVVAGVTDRAPMWMQEHGLEWFYRLVQEPGRLWRRYIVGNLKFVMLTLKYRGKGKRRNG